MFPSKVANRNPLISSYTWKGKFYPGGQKLPLVDENTLGRTVHPCLFISVLKKIIKTNVIILTEARIIYFIDWGGFWNDVLMYYIKKSLAGRLLFLDFYV